MTYSLFHLYLSLGCLILATTNTRSSLLATNFTKVIIPAVYHEWKNGPPSWVSNDTLREELGYSTFLYTKQDSSSPNYISTNRGCENGVYYKYIVDHYDDFPDIAIFTHASPHEHNDDWLDLVRCVRPNATYFSINLPRVVCRESWNGIWARYGIWLEQCLRDTLRITWDNITVAELNEKVPPTKSIRMCTHCCQQFLISRDQIRKRPLKVWKDLQYILSEQNVCHAGEPDYENLFAFNHSQRVRVGPEPSDLGHGGGKYGGSPGRLTQAVTSEHLAHVIFGHHDLQMSEPTNNDYCDQFYPSDICSGSPCQRNSTSIND